MPTAPRILLTTLPALALGACFDPLLDQDSADGADTASEGSTTDPATTDPGTTTDTTDTNADSTGAGDAPPVITAFTVNSSTMPAELQVAGMVAFDVDAMDDVGIDHVEIYDGDTLVITTTEIPYVTELLVTSADNGSHSYSAVVYDTAGQSTQSEAVPLSVNVVGGAMLVLREDIGDFRLSPILGSMPRITIDPSDEVTIVATTREDVVEDPNFGLMALSYSDTLSLLWTDFRWPSELGPYITFMNVGKPVYVTDSASWWTGSAMIGQTQRDRAIGVVDTVAAEITSIEPFGTVEEYFASPVALDSSGAIVLSPALGQLQKRPTLDGEPAWTVPIGNGSAFFPQVIIAPDDTIIVVLGEEGCSPTSDWCIYKLSAAGDVLWTRPGPASSPSSTVSAAMSSAGNIAVVGSVEGPLQLIVFDENGDTFTDQVITDDSFYEACDISYDSQGSLVIAGDLRADADDYQREAWAGRFDEQGNTMWLQVYELDMDHGVTGVTTNATGKLFAVGWADLFEQDLLGWSGRGWVAELAL